MLEYLTDEVLQILRNNYLNTALEILQATATDIVEFAVDRALDMVTLMSLLGPIADSNTASAAAIQIMDLGIVSDTPPSTPDSALFYRGYNPSDGTYVYSPDSPGQGNQSQDQSPGDQQWEQAPIPDEIDIPPAQVPVLPKLFQNVPPEMREQYYTNVLGPNYRTIMDTDAFGDTVSLGEYLDESEDNIIIKIDAGRGPSMIFRTSRTGAKVAQPLYQCTKTNSLAGVDTSIRYVNITNLGCGAIGIANFDAISIMLHSNYQVILLRDSGVISRPLVSHAVMSGGTPVSDAHCQDGTQSNIYKVYIPY